MTEPINQDDYPFLVRTTGDRIHQAPRVRVQWSEVNKTVRTIAGLGRVVEHDHWDHSRLAVSARGVFDKEDDRMIARTPVLNWFGRTHQSGEGQTVANSTPGLKKVLRRITVADREALQSVDNDIADLENRLSTLRKERKAIMQIAWRRGKELFVHEATPTGDGSGAIVLES